MKIKIPFFTLLFAGLAFAQTEAVSLKAAMKEMSSALKAITTQASDVNKNAASAALADKFVASAQQAKTFFPSSANDQASKEKFLKMIDGVITNGQELKAAFASNDNTKATALLNELVQNKKDGHTAFRQ